MRLCTYASVYLCAPVHCCCVCRHCQECVCSHRRTLLVRRFITALTQGGPQGNPRPIELHAHDPLVNSQDDRSSLQRTSATLNCNTELLEFLSFATSLTSLFTLHSPRCILHSPLSPLCTFPTLDSPFGRDMWVTC